jgi:hypothetical protein
VSRFYCILGLLIWGLASSVRADTYTLTTGETISGEPLVASAKDAGVQIKIDEGVYTNISWARFSQEALKKLATTPKFTPYVTPFIEIATPRSAKKAEPLSLKPPTRLAQPARQSLLGALFSSALGAIILLALYAANIYAAYEVALYRMRPPALVAGLAAIPFLGIFATIAFLALPAESAERAPESETASAPTPTVQMPSGADPLNPMQSDQVAHPANLRLHTDAVEKRGSELPKTVVFQRGQFTFNRRFIETKFAGFFGVVRRDAERDMVLVIKSMRGDYIGQRISRIAANDLHLQIQRAAASEEVMIPFTEIQEIQLKHKDAP